MTELSRKIRDNRGESIAETLIALLVAALGLLLLASAINSTSKIITTSNKKIKDYNDGELIAVKQDVDDDTLVGTITFNNEKLSYDNDSIYLDIDVFINDVISKNEVVSFTKKVSIGG